MTPFGQTYTTECVAGDLAATQRMIRSGGFVICLSAPISMRVGDRRVDGYLLTYAEKVSS